MEYIIIIIFALVIFKAIAIFNKWSDGGYY